MNVTGIGMGEDHAFSAETADEVGPINILLFSWVSLAVLSFCRKCRKTSTNRPTGSHNAQTKLNDKAATPSESIDINALQSRKVSTLLLCPAPNRRGN